VEGVKASPSYNPPRDCNISSFLLPEKYILFERLKKMLLVKMKWRIMTGEKN